MAVRLKIKKGCDILVRMPNWIGDLVMAVPLLVDIKRAFPEAMITTMCVDGVSTMLAHDPYVDFILRFEKPKGVWDMRRSAEIVRLIKEGGFDVGLLLTNSFSSAWWLWRGGVKNRIGYALNLRTPLLTHSLPLAQDRENRHQTEIYKLLLAPLGIAVSDSRPKLYLTDYEIESAKKMLALHGVNVGVDKVVGINPGAAYGSAKCWLPERFAAVTRELVRDDKVAVIYFGDAGQVSLIDNIVRQSKGHVINLAGKTSLRELMALISVCRVLLTNDSGPMHIAYALNTPTVALFGSTSYIRTGPYPPGKVIYNKTACSPCYKRVCPLDFSCMRGISKEMVLRELRRQLEKDSTISS